MSTSPSPDAQVRDVVRDADRRRRARAARAELARLAPAAAGLSLVTALVGRLLGWAPAVALGVLGVASVALAVRVYLQGRARPVSDALASRVDAEARLGGELRSAHWFASDGRRSEWTEYHVEQAARRASAVDWGGLYPTAEAGRAWAATGLLAAGAVALALVGSGPPRTPSPAELALADLEAVRDTLPSDLQFRLDQLLAGIDAGDLDGEGAAATLEQMRELLAQLDPALQQKLAELAEARNLDEARGEEQSMSQDELADMIENSNAGLPEDVRWALEDMANRLANSEEERQTNAENPGASQETGEPGLGSEQASAEQGAEAAEGGMQMMRQAASDAGESQMMMAGAGAMGGDSAGGEGGNSGRGAGEGEFESIAQALRQELIEAAQDTRGDNVQPDPLEEDIRRKTEQGTSSLGFTRVAPATFDRSRAVGPPTVPDARRPLLYNYFIRQR